MKLYDRVQNFKYSYDISAFYFIEQLFRYIFISLFAMYTNFVSLSEKSAIGIIFTCLYTIIKHTFTCSL